MLGHYFRVDSLCKKLKLSVISRPVDRSLLQLLIASVESTSYRIFLGPKRRSVILVDNRCRKDKLSNRFINFELSLAVQLVQITSVESTSYLCRDLEAPKILLRFRTYLSRNLGYIGQLEFIPHTYLSVKKPRRVNRTRAHHTKGSNQTFSNYLILVLEISSAWTFTYLDNCNIVTVNFCNRFLYVAVCNYLSVINCCYSQLAQVFFGFAYFLFIQRPTSLRCGTLRG